MNEYYNPELNKYLNIEKAYWEFYTAILISPIEENEKREIFNKLSETIMLYFSYIAKLISQSTTTNKKHK